MTTGFFSLEKEDIRYQTGLSPGQLLASVLLISVVELWYFLHICLLKSRFLLIVAIWHSLYCIVPVNNSQDKRGKEPPVSPHPWEWIWECVTGSQPTKWNSNLHKEWRISLNTQSFTYTHIATTTNTTKANGNSSAHVTEQSWAASSNAWSRTQKMPPDPFSSSPLAPNMTTQWLKQYLTLHLLITEPQEEETICPCIISRSPH